MKKLKIFYYKFFFPIYKNVNRILSKNKAFKKAHERYQNLSEREKYKKRQCAWEQHKNLSEEEKEKKRQYKNVLDDTYRTFFFFLECKK